LNSALLLRGQQLFVDFYEDPDLVHHLFSVLTETYLQVAAYLRRRTGSAAIATNRSILNVDASIYLHSNCPVQMISPAIYEKFLLPYELRLAQSLRPYGIHHCGNNLHRYAALYGRLAPAFVDVGWGSDVRRVRQALPDAFLNLRLSPVRMLQESAEVISRDIAALLEAAGPLDHVGLCCINMDDGTPDENVRVLLEFRKQIIPSGASE
jgi:uroporphyrinogen-III decarboxylase